MTNLKDSQKVKGHYKFKIKNKDGEEKKLWQENAFGRFLLGLRLDIRLPFITGNYSFEYNVDNLVVNAGLAAIASRINGDGGESEFTYIAVGTDDTAAAASDTTLGSEIVDSGLARASATASRETENVTNDKAKLLKEFTVTGTKAIKEVGIFNAASAGTMLSRTVISTKNVESGDTIEITYTIYSS